MKKILSITAMLLIVSMAFFACDTREYSGSPATVPIWEKSGADCGDLLEAIGFYSNAGGPGSSSGITLTDNTMAFDMTSGQSNEGVKVTLPANYTLYDGVKITFEVVSIDPTSVNVKFGFKSEIGKDITPYDDYEIHFGNPTTVGTVKSLTIPKSKLTTSSFLFTHNGYSPDTGDQGDGGAKPATYVTLYSVKVNKVELLVP